MKNIINFYYNLFPNKVIKQDNFYYFWIDDKKYYFVPFFNDEKKVLQIYEKLLKENRKTNKILLNKNGSIVTNYNNINYSLILVDCIENDIIRLQDFDYIPMESKIIDWSQIWEQKIDYYEYQVNQRGLGKNNILDSFSYYVGLGENAIQYYNLTKKDEINIAIQHKRIYAPNYEINYFNPINMILDYSVRDLSEYIKFSFFFGTFNEDEVIKCIDNLKLNNTMFNLFYARLLFPTYYFDCYDKYINEEDDENRLVSIISKTSQFEYFLKKIYLLFSHKYELLRIEWVLN